MSAFGTILHSIISLKNNKLLRKGHSFLNQEKKLHRRIIKKNKIQTYQRSPKEMEALKLRYKKRHASILKKQILFLVAVLCLAVTGLIWILNY